MSTKLQDIKKQYPEADYFGGKIYEDEESEHVLSENGNITIQNHYYETLGCSRSGVDVTVALEHEFNMEFGPHDEQSWIEAFKNV